MVFPVKIQFYLIISQKSALVNFFPLLLQSYWKSFGKVELNLASTPSLECLRRQNFRQSWTRSWMSSTKTTGGTVYSTTRRIIENPDPNPAVFLEKTTSPVHYSHGQKSSKFLWWTGMSWLSTWTILSRSRCPGRGKDLFFKHSVEKLQPRWFFVRKTKWRPQKIQSKITSPVYHS